MTTPHAMGYRLTPGGGPRIRSDIVDVYVFRRGATAHVEFLQLLRATEPLKATWHPIMGHVEAGETAAATARRELREETGLDALGPEFLGLWALEQVHPYYVAAIDAIVLSPRFAAEAAANWAPSLNPEHSAARWTTDPADFMWPGQQRAVEEILREIIDPRSLAREALRVQ